jgi:hypothetical protein
MRIVPDKTSKRSGFARLWIAGFASMLLAAVVVRSERGFRATDINRTFLSRRCGKPASEQHFGVERSWHDLRREVANKNCTPLIC